MDVGVLFQFLGACRLHSFGALMELTHWLRVKHISADGYVTPRLQWAKLFRLALKKLRCRRVVSSMTLESDL